ncbi:MAG: PAS domain-containing protein [Oscillospiraceae bacterium]|nr:PAS domain-containing protein [Oscillospiraceae bacterium]
MYDRLEDYKKLVEFLSSLLGENCEVVLQDCREDQCGIIAIGNGAVTNRKVGGPLTDYALEVIQSKRWKNEDWDINYRSTKNHKNLRSSTYFIKDDNHDLIGMLCVNIDMTVYEQLSHAILSLGGLHLLPSIPATTSIEEPHMGPPKETFFNNIAEMVNMSMEEVFAEEAMPQITRLNLDERLRLLENLQKKGVFLIKGAISEVAAILRCSEPTLYRSLSKCQKTKA